MQGQLALIISIASNPIFSTHMTIVWPLYTKNTQVTLYTKTQSIPPRLVTTTFPTLTNSLILFQARPSQLTSLQYLIGILGPHDAAATRPLTLGETTLLQSCGRAKPSRIPHDHVICVAKRYLHHDARTTSPHIQHFAPLSVCHVGGPCHHAFHMMMKAPHRQTQHTSQHSL